MLNMGRILPMQYCPAHLLLCCFGVSLMMLSCFSVSKQWVHFSMIALLSTDSSFQGGSFVWQNAQIIEFLEGDVTYALSVLPGWL